MGRQRVMLGWVLAAVAISVLISGCAPALGVSGSASRAEEPMAEPAASEEGFYVESEQIAMDQAGEMAAQPTAAAAAAPGMPPQQIERLIIRNGSITVTVEDTREAKRAIVQMVNEMAGEGAYVVSSNEYGGGADVSPYISMTIRVPAARFTEAMDRTAALAVEGTIPARSESGQDVTEEYVDLQARLESLEAARDRLLNIMANAQSTEELLQAEAQLTQREAEIESIKGRMQYLEQSAALSSINIELQPYILSQPVDTRWRPAETVREALDSLLRSLRGAGDFLIFVTIFCGPWLLVIVPVGYGIFRGIRGLVRRRRARRAAAASASSEPGSSN